LPKRKQYICDLSKTLSDKCDTAAVVYESKEMIQNVLWLCKFIRISWISFSCGNASGSTPFTGFLFASTSNIRSAPSWETVLLALLYNTSRLSVSQLYLVVSPFGLWLGATWLFPRHERLWLSLEVLLLWAHWTGTSYLRDLFPISSDQFPCRHLKTSLYVSEDTDLGQERLWFKWCYINVWLQLQLQYCGTA